VETLHASGWLVEPCWLVRDGAGERAWHRVVDPWGAEHWCTTSALQELLHRHGLDIADLTAREPVQGRRLGGACE
jgi:hypothetical protein